jgi:GPI mannosyltransferase 3
MNSPATSPSRKGRAPPLRIKRRPTPPDDAQVILQDRRIFLGLFCIRIFNALTINTFFQPDEYYQSLEPAWKLVFGYGERTWEWTEGIRGFLHPSVFALAWALLKILGLKDPDMLVILFRFFAELEIAAPKVIQGVLAAICDYWTYRLARRLFNYNIARWTVLSQLSR